jgi:hypothetical protein
MQRHLSPPRVNATRRLLQSAVRDAVAPAPNSTKCGSKRLRSVISTEFGERHPSGNTASLNIYDL